MEFQIKEYNFIINQHESLIKITYKKLLVSSFCPQLSYVLLSDICGIVCDTKTLLQHKLTQHFSGVKAH